MKKIKDFFKKRTLMELILIVFIVLFFVHTLYLGALVSHLSDISSNFDNIIGRSSGRCGIGRNCSRDYRLKIDGSIGATIDGSIDIDNTYGNSLKVEHW